MLTIPWKSCCFNFKVAMIKYCKFEGRARLSEFWYFKLSITIIDFIYAFIAKLILEIANNKRSAEDIEKLDIVDSIPPCNWYSNWSYFYITEYICFGKKIPWCREKRILLFSEFNTNYRNFNIALLLCVRFLPWCKWIWGFYQIYSTC